MKFIDAATLARLVPPARAVQVLEQALRAGLDPEATPPRAHADLPSGQLLMMPAGSGRYAGVKVVSVAPDNPRRGLPRIQGTYLLFDGDTLAPLAAIDGIALTSLRTPAVSALAVHHLAAPGSRRLVVFGTGPQAWGHILALRAVRPVDHVTLFGRSPAGVQALGERCRSLGLTVQIGYGNAASSHVTQWPAPGASATPATTTPPPLPGAAAAPTFPGGPSGGAALSGSSSGHIFPGGRSGPSAGAGPSGPLSGGPSSASGARLPGGMASAPRPDAVVWPPRPTSAERAGSRTPDRSPPSHSGTNPPAHPPTGPLTGPPSGPSSGPVGGPPSGPAFVPVRPVIGAPGSLAASVTTTQAVSEADIIACCTTARNPLFPGKLTRDGATVVAVGSHEPDAREVDDDLVARAILIVEARSAALAEAGDVIIPVRNGTITTGHLAGNLAELVSGQVPIGPGPRLFKSVGMAWEDLVVAAAAYEAWA